LNLDEETQADWDRTLTARFEGIRGQDEAAYGRYCASFDVAVDWLRVGDTAQAIAAVNGVFQNRPRYDVRLSYSLWIPGIDGIRDDPRSREALSEALELTGMSGGTLRRAQETD
jgi:hypothetical protein